MFVASVAIADRPPNRFTKTTRQMKMVCRSDAKLGYCSKTSTANAAAITEPFLTPNEICTAYTRTYLLRHHSSIYTYTHTYIHTHVHTCRH